MARLQKKLRFTNTFATMVLQLDMRGSSQHLPGGLPGVRRKNTFTKAALNVQNHAFAAGPM